MKTYFTDISTRIAATWIVKVFRVESQVYVSGTATLNDGEQLIEDTVAINYYPQSKKAVIKALYQGSSNTVFKSELRKHYKAQLLSDFE